MELILWGISYLPSFVFKSKEDSALKILFVLMGIALYIVNLETSVGMLKILLAYVDKRKPKMSELFEYFRVGLLARFFIGSLLYSLLVMIGLLFLIIPGIYFAVRYYFVPYIIVDKDADIFESFDKSAKLTKGAEWQLLLFGVLSFLIFILGAAALVVGLFVAIPVVYIASVYIYRKLDHHEHFA